MQGLSSVHTIREESMHKFIQLKIAVNQ